MTPARGGFATPPINGEAVGICLSTAGPSSCRLYLIALERVPGDLAPSKSDLYLSRDIITDSATLAFR